MSDQFLNSSVLKLCKSLCLISMIGAPIFAEEGDNTPFTNILASYSNAPTPKIEEDSTNAAGVNTSYKWDGVSSRGNQAAVTLLRGTVNQNGGFIWGGDLVFASYNITPTNYKVGGVRFANDSSASLGYQSLGVNVVAGYQYGISALDAFHGYIEILPLLGIGFAQASSEVHSGGNDTKSDGIGHYYQYGVRVGAYLTERRWIAGINASYIAGNGSVDIDYSGGFKSTLMLETSGVTFGGALGYRF